MVNYAKEKEFRDILKFEGIMSRGFGIAPQIIMRDERLSIEAKGIYCYLQSFAGNKNVAFPTRETILNELGISKTRYYKYLNQLIEYDYIRIEREVSDTNWKGRNIYIIVSNPEAKKNAGESIENKKKQNSKQFKSVEKSISKNQFNSSGSSRPEEREFDEKKYCKDLYKKLEMDNLKEEYPEDANEIDAIYHIIEDMVSSKEIKIGGAVKDQKAILDVLEKLSPAHIIYVFVGIKENRDNIQNKRAWTQTCIINCIYEDEQRIRSRIEKYKRKTKQDKTICLDTEVSSKEREKERDDILHEHEYLNQRYHRCLELYPKLAKANINGNADKQYISDELNNLNEEMLAYCKKKGIDFKLLE